MKKLVMFSSIFNDEAIGKKISEMSEKGYDSNICYIPSFTSATDFKQGHIYKSFVEMGFSGENVSDFDVCFKFDKSKVYLLENADIIILGGGNTFLFQWLLIQREIMPILSEKSMNGTVLVGESAGSIMMSDKIDIAQFADNDFVLSENHSGIGVSPIDIKPHFQSWYEKLGLFFDYSVKNDNRPIYCLEDGMCVVVDGDNILTYGEEPFVIQSGELHYNGLTIGGNECVYN